MDTVELAGALRALAAPSRLKIIELLQTRSFCVRALTARLDISQPAVSQHLAVLKQAGLVDSDRKGTMVHYRVDRERLEAVMNALAVVGKVGVPGSARVVR
jgi:ArsR family transcriptional regulator, arsenate/arsenite/antimonite-responsive transcriptional repressor